MKMNPEGGKDQMPSINQIKFDSQLGAANDEVKGGFLCRQTSRQQGHPIQLCAILERDGDGKFRPLSAQEARIFADCACMVGRGKWKDIGALGGIDRGRSLRQDLLPHYYSAPSDVMLDRSDPTGGCAAMAAAALARPLDAFAADDFAALSELNFATIGAFGDFARSKIKRWEVVKALKQDRGKPALGRLEALEKIQTRDAGLYLVQPRTKDGPTSHVIGINCATKRI